MPQLHSTTQRHAPESQATCSGYGCEPTTEKGAEEQYQLHDSERIYRTLPYPWHPIMCRKTLFACAHLIALARGRRCVPQTEHSLPVHTVHEIEG